MDRDTGSTVLDDAVVYIRDGSIAAVQPASATPPAGWAAASTVNTGGTLFPGLIELHNHLPYDVLGLWPVPKRYSNRDQWSAPSTPQYHQLITGPMQVLGAQPDVVAAVVRFVEMRCLIGGTTTSQGVTLATAPGLVKHFRGLVRNVEATGDPALPPAATHIADVEAVDRTKFLARISGSQRMILHLAEGTDPAAHNHFAALEGTDGTWAITPNLIGIHCVALTDTDFATVSSHGGAMVWSPLSNLLLYGQTANLGAALAHHVPVALGSDWSPSGSINLLAELKIARLAAPGAGATVTNENLVAMVTSVPARLLGWEAAVGSIGPGRRADLIVVNGTGGDPHGCLVDATEADIALVVINGTPRVGVPELMSACGLPAGEDLTVGGQARRLNLAEEAADPEVAALTLAQARAILSEALNQLPQHQTLPPAAIPDGQVRLAVEGLVDNGMSPRHHLALRGMPTGPNLRGAGPSLAAAAPSGLPALTLPSLTAVDDPSYYPALAASANLPSALRSTLATWPTTKGLGVLAPGDSEPFIESSGPPLAT
jgi:5-methylthioadenosine/S-adenosylhomocysteine deaminase